MNFTEHSPQAASSFAAAPAPPSGGIGTPAPCAEESTPTLAVGGSRLWRVLYLYCQRLKAKSTASDSEPSEGGFSPRSELGRKAQGTMEESANTRVREEEYCPVCGYYCNGKGGVGCIDKPRAGGSR